MRDNSRKSSVAPEEGACNMIKCLQWCHSVVVLHCGWCRWQVLKKQDECVELRNCHLWSCCIDFDHLFLLNQVWVSGACITHNSTKPMSDVTGRNSLECMLLPFFHKKLYTTFFSPHIHGSTHLDLWTQFNVLSWRSYPLKSKERVEEAEKRHTYRHHDTLLVWHVLIEKEKEKEREDHFCVSVFTVFRKVCILNL